MACAIAWTRDRGSRCPFPSPRSSPAAGGSSWTGACGVIGRWIAEAFADAGARLALSDHRADALADVATGLPGDGHLTHATELTDADSIAALVAAVADALGRAGPRDQTTPRSIPAASCSTSTWPSGTASSASTCARRSLVAQGFAKAMIAAGRGGSIVNVSSGRGAQDAALGGALLRLEDGRSTA